MRNRFRYLGFGLWSLVIIMLLSITACSQSVKLTQIEKDATKWKFPVAHRVISGQSGYHLKYISLQALADSVGFSLVGSGTVTNVATAFPVTGGPITNTGTIGVDTTDATLTALVTQYDLSQKGNGTVTNVTGTAPIVITGTSTVTPNVTISQSGSGTNGYLSSTDWNTFNNKISTRFQLNGAGSYYGGDLGLNSRNTGTYPGWAYSLGTIFFDMPAASSGQVLKYNGTGWTAGTDNNTVYDYWSVQANGGGAYALTNLANLNFANGTGINWSRSGGTMTATNVGVTSLAAGSGISVSGATGGVTISNSLPFNYLGVQANAGAIGSTLTNGATLNLTGSGSTSVSRSGNTFTISSSGGTDSQSLSYGFKSGTDIPLDIQSGASVYFREGTGISLGRTASNVMTLSSTVVNTDNQTLSFSSPTLSISGGNNVTLPVLPSGTVNQTLRYDGSAWNPTSMLQTTTSRVDINSWPGTVILGSKLMVNGNIQYNSVGSAATTVAGRDADGGLTGVTVGSGLSLSAGTLSSTATGTVTSVGITNGGGITVSGSPVTTSGNITLTAADQSATNEIQVLSTSGAAGNVALSNGGGTININVNDADASITNEGYLGVVASGTYIKGYNSSGTATGNGVQMLAGTGLSVATGGNNTNGGQIQYSINNYYGGLSGGGNFLTTTPAAVDYTSVSAFQNLTPSTASNSITTSPGGDYLLLFTGSFYSVGTNRDVSCEFYLGGSAYASTMTQEIKADMSANISGSLIVNTGGSAVSVRCWYNNSSGSGSSIQVSNSNLSVQKLN